MVTSAILVHTLKLQ